MKLGLNITIFCKFHDHVDTLFVLEVVNEPDNVRVLELALNFNLPLDIVDGGE